MKILKQKISFNFILKTAVIILLIAALSGFRLLIVMSGSMEPYMPTGSICIVNTNTDFNSIKKNNIITYSLADMKITHRVKEVNKEKHYIIVKGDNNLTNDIGSVTRENYYGKVITHIPYIGYVFFYLKKNIIKLSIIIVMLIIVIKRLSSSHLITKMKACFNFFLFVE